MKGKLWREVKLPRRPATCSKARYRTAAEAWEQIDRMIELASRPEGEARALSKPGRWTVYECRHCGPGVLHIGHTPGQRYPNDVALPPLTYGIRRA